MLVGLGGDEVSGRHSPDSLTLLDKWTEMCRQPLALCRRQGPIHRLGQRGDPGVSGAV